VSRQCDAIPLIELLRSELDGAATAAVLEHLEECRTCRERLQTMAALEALYRRRHLALRRQWKAWGLAAGVVLLVLVPPVYLSLTREASRRTQLSDLATQEAHPYFPLNTRSGVSGRSPAERAFRAYGGGRFEEAGRWFTEARPTADILFYSGVTHYLLEDYESALGDFAEALELDSRWERAALWYQANTHLKRGEEQKAREALERLFDRGNGDYREKASGLLEEIRRIGSAR